MQKEASLPPWEKEGIMLRREPPGYPERERESCWEGSLPGMGGEEGGYLVLPCPVPWWPYYPRVHSPVYYSGYTSDRPQVCRTAAAGQVNEALPR